MARDLLLQRIAGVYLVVLAAAAVTLRLLGKPLDGLLLGGGLAGFSFVTFWIVARAIVEPGRKVLAYVLGSMKVVLYMTLTAAVLSGRLGADAGGFALGVTCFVGTIVAVGLLAPRARALGEPGGGL